MRCPKRADVEFEITDCSSVGCVRCYRFLFSVQVLLLLDDASTRSIVRPRSELHRLFTPFTGASCMAQ